MRWLLWSVVVSSTLLGAGCGAQEIKGAHVDEKDVAMHEAIDKARASIDKFATALDHHRLPNHDFALRMRLHDVNGTEDVWITSLYFDGRRFHGNLEATPAIVTTYKKGDRVSVPRLEILDWRFLVEHDEVVGAWTLRLERERLSPEERKRFDERFPFKLN